MTSQRVEEAGRAPSGRRHVLSRLVLVLFIAVVGVALTWVFCQGYIWKIAHEQDAPGRLFWEPGSLVAVTVIEFSALGVFIVRAAMRAHRIAPLVTVILVELVFNIVLTVALFGIPVY